MHSCEVIPKLFPPFNHLVALGRRGVSHLFIFAFFREAVLQLNSLLITTIYREGHVAHEAGLGTLVKSEKTQVGHHRKHIHLNTIILFPQLTLMFVSSNFSKNEKRFAEYAGLTEDAEDIDKMGG